MFNMNKLSTPIFSHRNSSSMNTKNYLKKTTQANFLGRLQICISIETLQAGCCTSRVSCMSLCIKYLIGSVRKTNSNQLRLFVSCWVGVKAGLYNMLTCIWRKISIMCKTEPLRFTITPAFAPAQTNSYHICKCKVLFSLLLIGMRTASKSLPLNFGIYIYFMYISLLNI